jgi:hypothetical protein
MRTVRVWFCCLGFVAMGSAREPGLPAPESRYMAILIPDQPYSASAIQEMGREAAAILKRSGIILRLQVGVTREAFDGSIVMVKLRGHCDTDVETHASPTGPIGWTHAVNGDLLPFAELACDPIWGTVRSTLRRADAAYANRMLGRALGRVLAHELYHIAGETSKHGRDGVAQASLTPEELTSNHLELDPEDIQTIRSRQSAR